MRKPATGRFNTRAQLIEWVWRAYLNTPANTTDIAAQCGVSPSTVHKIINTKEGYMKPIGMKTIGTITIGGESLLLRQTTYSDNGRVAVVVQCEDGEPFAALTVNLPDDPLPEGCLHVKTWGDNATLREPALATGLFTDTGERVKTGFVQAEVWKYHPRA